MEGTGQKPDSASEEVMVAAGSRSAGCDNLADAALVDMGSTVDKDSKTHTEAAYKERPAGTEPLDEDSTEHLKPTNMDSTEGIEPTGKGCSALMEPMDKDGTSNQQPAGKDIARHVETPVSSVASDPAGLRRSSSGGSQDATMESVDGSDDGDDDGGGGGTSTGDLPDEILEHLLTFVLPYEDMQNCKLVSRRWYHAVKHVERKLHRLLGRCLDELSVAWFHYDTPNPAGSSPLAAAHRVITKRCAHSAAMLDGRMYVFGGCSSRMTSFNDLWWLELGELEWRRPQVVGSYPSPKAYASLVTYGDKLVLFGGWSQAAPYPLHQNWKLFDELHIYDTKECRWQEVRGVSSSCREAGLPGVPQLAERWPPRMARHAASVHGHQMVVTGGLHHHNNSRFSATNEVWVFDLLSEEWRHQRCSRPAPSARYGHSQIALDERHMLLLGGSGGPNQLRQDAWLLEVGDPAAEWRWHQLTVTGAESAPSQLWCHPACQVGDKVVVLGRGRGDTGNLSMAAAQPGRGPSRPVPAAPAPAPARAPAAAAGPAAAPAAPAAAVAAVRLGERRTVSAPAAPPSRRGIAIVPGRAGLPGGAPGCAGPAVGAAPVRGLGAILDVSPLRTGHNRGPGLPPSRLLSSRPPSGPETGFLSRRQPPPDRLQAPPEPLARPSIRPNANCSRDRRLAGLLRMQQRLEAAAAERAAPHPRPRCRPPLTAGYRLVAAAGRRPLTLHVLDVSGAVSERTASWRQCQRQDGPDERILYSLVAARGELVLFGGIVTPPRAAEAAADPEQEQNAAFNAVSFVTIPCDMFN